MSTIPPLPVVATGPHAARWLAQARRSSPTLNLFTDRRHYLPEHRRLLVHLLRPVWEAAEAEPSAGSCRIVSAPEQADVVVLPMTWHYYVEHGRLQQALALGATARAAGKPLLVFAAGDCEPVVPIDNAVVLHPGPNRRARPTAARSLAVPSFVPDLRALYYPGPPVYREKQPRPVVGFCGYATTPTHRLALATLRNLADNVRYAVGALSVVPPPVVPAVVLRGRVLRALRANPAIDDRFVIRDDYRAGLRDAAERADPRHPTRMEFVRAIHDCDYTVCIRGGGNFSLRLYETLALGRIPIFVDTDSMLPYDFLFDWRRYCCWIDEHEVDRVADKVAAFHASLSPSEFRERQQACRWLWEEWLSTEGFRRHFDQYVAHSGGFEADASDNLFPGPPIVSSPVGATQGPGEAPPSIRR
ncbi:MAG: hypothetical protein AB7U83_00270 [Vicinamibacterales bacterium]